MADVFAGVGTTALGLELDRRVRSVLAVEYSPFAQWVAATKLMWSTLDPARMKAAVASVMSTKLPHNGALPGLTSFRNPRVFDQHVARALMSLRTRIDTNAMDEQTHAFLRLGLASVVEPLSNVIKDGRALRVIGSGHRKRKTIAPRDPLQPTGDIVLDTAARQWQAMIEDVELLVGKRNDQRATITSVIGDARHLDLALGREKESPFRENSVGLCLASPPYLNFIDYTEVYKLELWLLGFVQDQQQFRELRLGTLRSHPSINFPDGPSENLLAETGAMKVVRLIGDFLSANHARPAVSKAVVGYFEDMVLVLREQLRILEPGGHNVIVVGNSTFSSRPSVDDVRQEGWRLPILTDVLLARLGQAVGFQDVAVWQARDLRPRNVRAGTARESLVVMRKAR